MTKVNFQLILYYSYITQTASVIKVHV